MMPKPTSDTAFFTDGQRMELRSHVNLAGEAVPRLWPMRTFISRNPLQGLEHLRFEEAVQRGAELFGAQGYLSCETYRELFARGRIQRRHVEEVLRALASDEQILFGGRPLSHLEVLGSVMLHDVPSDETSWSASESASQVATIAQWLRGVPGLDDVDVGKADQLLDEIGRHDQTMARWCDLTFGTDIEREINDQLIVWCSAFCDEGEAAWPMPNRERTFFRAWKKAAEYDWNLSLLGIDGAAKKIRALSDRPEDALLESLHRLKVPAAAWEDYLTRHLVALPGWAGFIKWRAEQTGDPWQEAYRIDLVKYLAVRLFYERELVEASCRRILGEPGNFDTVRLHTQQFPHAVWFRHMLAKGQLPKEAVDGARSLTRWWRSPDLSQWEQLGRQWYAEYRRSSGERARLRFAQVFVRLAEAWNIQPNDIPSTAPQDVRTLMAWIVAFPEARRQAKWLEASEIAHQESMLGRLEAGFREEVRPEQAEPRSVRAAAQVVFCIDVRSELFRRHLEQRGGYETFGFAGFFGLPLSYRPWGSDCTSDLCPVLLKPKHTIREVPRTYHEEAARRRKSSRRLGRVGQELFHDLKHNVITPYVMVEAIGWLFGWPLLGKTLFPRWYHRLATWLKRFFMPVVATTLTVDKLTSTEAEEMVAAEQRMQIARWVRGQMPDAGGMLTADRLEAIRLQALGMQDEATTSLGFLGRLLSIPRDQELAMIDGLRQDCRLTPRGTAARLDRITQTGFTITEQAYYVEMAFRLMGLTSSWSRLVILCGHGSTSENNPYESALDCGACGGSHGLPNARAFALMANRPQVRELLAQRGIVIPPDTHFLAALHDTTTDYVRIADLEDVPPTHRGELAQVLADVHETGALVAAERARALHESTPAVSSSFQREIERRSMDWAQVRPEWGLARNSLFIIGSRRLTNKVDLEGRSFLHSYDENHDDDGKLLEIIMTAPLIVAQWINMEYYFSTVAPEAYGSGSKVYHNVTSRLGVMSGNRSDLRMGLPVQTVMDGARPYHEPMRLTTIIEAPLKRIEAVIARQHQLERLFTNRWLHLVAYASREGRFYRYVTGTTWEPLRTEADAAIAGVGAGS